MTVLFCFYAVSMVGRRKAVTCSHSKQQISVACNGGVTRHAGVRKLKFGNVLDCIDSWHSASYDSVVRAWWSMLFPRGCAGCDAVDAVLCTRCVRALQCWQCASFTAAVCGNRYACGLYEHAVRRAILQWKDHGDIACDNAFAALLADLVIKVIRKIMQQRDTINNRNEGIDNSFDTTFSHDCNKFILVVPVPSSKSSIRYRGRNHMQPIACMVAQNLSNNGIAACAANILCMNARVTAKSVQTAGSRGRSRRASHAFTVNYRVLQKLRAKQNVSHSVILIDDIVTTGSTMSSCAVALQHAKLNVLAAFSLACVRSCEDDTKNYVY